MDRLNSEFEASEFGTLHPSFGWQFGTQYSEYEIGALRRAAWKTARLTVARHCGRKTGRGAYSVLS